MKMGLYIKHTGSNKPHLQILCWRGSIFDWSICTRNAEETFDDAPIGLSDWCTCIMNAVNKCDSVWLKRLMLSPVITKLNFYGTEGHTLLIKATIKGYVGICRLLLYHGADVYAPAVPPGERQTVLFHDCLYGGYTGHFTMIPGVHELDDHITCNHCAASCLI